MMRFTLRALGADEMRSLFPALLTVPDDPVEVVTELRHAFDTLVEGVADELSPRRKYQFDVFFVRRSFPSGHAVAMCCWLQSAPGAQ